MNYGIQDNLDYLQTAARQTSVRKWRIVPLLSGATHGNTKGMVQGSKAKGATRDNDDMLWKRSIAKIWVRLFA